MVDYKDFKGGDSTSSNDDQSTFNRRWWTSSKTDMPNDVVKIAKFLVEKDSARLTQYSRDARLYSNMQGLGAFRSNVPAPQVAKDRVTYNGIQSGIDTVVSKMAKNKPKPLFLTSGGDYKIQRKAKKLDKFCEGIFYENKAYKLGPIILRDAGVVGDGLVHVFDLHGRVTYERTPANELFVDPVESLVGDPRQMFRVKYLDRQVLLEIYPEKQAAIKRAQAADPATMNMDIIQNVSDLIMVVEAWHLPSGPEANDGKHVVCIEGEYLVIEEYKRKRFPFARLAWSERFYGFWSQSGAEQVMGTQLQINKILYVIQRSMHLQGSFKILMERGSRIVKEYFNNEIGAILDYTGTPPQYITPPMVAPELYSHLETLKRQLFEILGVSMLSAASAKPEGLDSGKALREFNNIESDRFQVLGQKYELFMLDLADLSISVAQEIFTKDGEYKVKVPGKKFIEEIDWKDVDLEEDQFVMKVYPVSSLPQDPAGRLSTVQEYMQAGMLTVRQGRRLLDFPDLEQVEGLANATEDWIHECLEKIVDDGEYTAPDQNDDLQTAGELVIEYINQAKQAKLDVEKMNMLLTYQEQVKTLGTLAQQGAQANAAAAAGAGGPPQAAPQAPPTSDMIPNAPGAQQ